MKNSGNTYFIVFFTATVIYSVYVAFNYFAPAITDQAEPGIFYYDNEKEADNIRLRGDVWFFPGQLLAPEDFKGKMPDSAITVSIPEEWNHYTEAPGLKDGKGYGTFYFVIQLDHYGQYGLSTRHVNNAYRLWINGRLMGKKGKVGKTAGSSAPEWGVDHIYFTPDEKEIHVVMQVSNYDYYTGGVINSMLFGQAEKLESYQYRTVAMELMLLGFIIIMAVYHFGLYFLYPSEKPLLYFSLLAIVIAVRQYLYGEKILYNLASRLDWYMAVKAEYITLVLTVPLILLYLRSFFKGLDIKALTKGFLWFCYIFCVMVVFVPVWLTTWMFTYFQWVLLFGAAYTILIVSRGLRAGRPLALHFLFGVSITMLFCTVEVVRYNTDPDMPYTLHMGMFVLLFTQSFALTRKIARGFSDSQRVAKILEAYNEKLSAMVKGRTRELTDANEEIRNQNQLLGKKAAELEDINKRLRDLDNYKQTMTHMVIHDLKNPLNIIINLTEDKLLRNISHQMLDQISDIMDIQKHEEAGLKPDIITQNIRVVIHEAVNQVRVLSDEKDLSLCEALPEKIMARADNDLVRRVVVNLLTNAVKYAPRGSEIVIGHEEKGNKHRLWVADWGLGVPDEWKERVFEKYSQVEARKSGKAYSSGLGLNFCKIAMDAHGENIGVEDNDEKGARFWFELERG